MSVRWSWIPDVRGVRRGKERVYLLRAGAGVVAQLVLPLPFRGNDIEHGETACLLERMSGIAQDRFIATRSACFLPRDVTLVVDSRRA